MVQVLEAVFDGKVFRPVAPFILEANTRVRLEVEAMPQAAKVPTSFLRTARSLQLDGPPDWATNLDAYLYGEKAEGDG